MDGTCIRSAPNKLLLSCEQAVTCHSDQRFKTHHYDDKCAGMRFLGSTLEHLGYHVPQTVINRQKGCMFEIDPNSAHHHPNRPISSEIGNLLVKGNEEDVDCKGSWGSWSACSSEGKQKRIYAVGTAKQGWGQACLYENGEEEERDCTFVADVDCVGDWEEDWSACIDGKKTRKFSVETPGKGNGKACDHAHGHVESKVCDAAAGGNAGEAADDAKKDGQQLFRRGSIDNPSQLLISTADLYDALSHTSNDPLIHSVKYIMM